MYAAGLMQSEQEEDEEEESLSQCASRGAFNKACLCRGGARCNKR